MLLMKMMIDIADPILEQARRVAARKGSTLRSLVERGLRHVLAQEVRAERPFKLRDASVTGRGWLRPELQDASWDKLRKLIYEGHGG
jgi:hypothetical protein